MSKFKRVLISSGLTVSVLLLSACGSSQISSSLTENINYAISNSESVEESSVVIEYRKGILGPSVDVTGDIEYNQEYAQYAEQAYKSNMKDIAYIVRDVGGIDKGTVKVKGHSGSVELNPGIAIGKDSDKVKISKLLN